MAQAKPWLIDPVSPETRQKVTAYKALRGLRTIDQALNEMADIALASLPKK